MQGVHQLIALGRQGALGASQIGASLVQRALDRFYGPPQLAHARAVPRPPKRRADERTVSASVNPPLPAAVAAEDQPVTVSTDQVQKLPVAERVRTAKLVGRHGVTYGFMWLYLYPQQGMARRVLKITDPHLAKALKRKHFHFGEVPFDPVIGSTPLFDALHAECRQLLNGRRICVKEVPPEQAEPKGALSGKVDDSGAAARGERELSPHEAPQERTAATVPAVQGEAYQGVVTSAGRALRTHADGASYNTFCLSLNDGKRDITLFGNELERLSGELRVRPGERVRVVFLGKQLATVPGKSSPVFRNRYQLERVETR
jgi:hypothetical protein